MKKHGFVVYLEEPIGEWLDELCAAARRRGLKGISKSQVMRDALMYYMDHVNLYREYLGDGT